MLVESVSNAADSFELGFINRDLLVDYFVEYMRRLQFKTVDIFVGASPEVVLVQSIMPAHRQEACLH